MELTSEESGYLAVCVEGFFFGLYSGIFAIYLQCHGLQKSTGRAKNILFYALWVLYALSAVNRIIHTLEVIEFYWLNSPNLVNWVRLSHIMIVIQVTVFACCDFIAQSILIYRCWIMWGCSIRIVIVPSFLAFAFLAIWIVGGISPLSIVDGQLSTIKWGTTLMVTGIALSMSVNALVTGLIVFRIFEVFQEVKTRTADEKILRDTGASTLQRVIFILIESGMVLFLIQLARVMVTIISNVSLTAYYLVASIHEMLNGIIPTIILVWVSMGLSFHDKSSMVDSASIGSLHFAPSENPNSISKTGSINILDEERRDDGGKMLDHLTVDDSLS